LRKAGPDRMPGPRQFARAGTASQPGAIHVSDTSMRTYRVTQRISAPPDVVWKFVSDVLAWPEWLPTFDSVIALTDQELQVGSRYRVLQPKLRPAVWAVTSCRRNESFAWQSSSPGLAMRAVHALRPTSPDTSELSLEFSFSGALSLPAGLLAGKLTQRYISIEAGTFKRLAEDRRDFQHGPCRVA